MTCETNECVSKQSAVSQPTPPRKNTHIKRTHLVPSTQSDYHLPHTISTFPSLPTRSRGGLTGKVPILCREIIIALPYTQEVSALACCWDARGRKEGDVQIFILMPFPGVEPASRQKLVPVRRTALVR